MVKTGSKLKKTPIKSPEEKIRDTDIGLKNTRKPKEKLTETEQLLLSDIIEGRLSQYPLVTKNGSTRYAKTHRVTASLKKKLIRMKLIVEGEE